MSEMTPEERAEKLTGVKDTGGPCSGGSLIARTRAIAQAIREAENAAYDRAAQIVSKHDPYLSSFGSRCERAIRSLKSQSA